MRWTVGVQQRASGARGPQFYGQVRVLSVGVALTPWFTRKLRRLTVGWFVDSDLVVNGDTSYVKARGVV